MTSIWMSRRGDLAAYGAAIAGPGALTALLSGLTQTESRDYVYLYLAIVAALGVAGGLGPALSASAAGFLLVDFFFVPPVHTLAFADATDLVNLGVFFAVGGLVGTLGSRRRLAQLRAERMAAEIRAATGELERLNRDQAEAASVAVELAQTQQQVRLLEETDRVRRDLLANVSHELRTPLATIVTGVSSQVERDDLPGDTREELGAVSREAERLGRLVADMLDMARIEGNALDLRLAECDVGDAIAVAAQRLHIRNPERDVTIAVTSCDGLEVLADWDRLGQILDNLLANADRHGPAGTTIAVRAVEGDRGRAVVHVIDHGGGVPIALRAHLFERFARGPGGDHSGTGLGLAITKGLVEAHAGRIWLAESANGEGAHFAFTMPLSSASRDSAST